MTYAAGARCGNCRLASDQKDKAHKSHAKGYLARPVSGQGVLRLNCSRLDAEAQHLQHVAAMHCIIMLCIYMYETMQKVSKVSKAKGQNSGRTYTSKYRGVHQTFPTKRWEAQFR